MNTKLIVLLLLAACSGLLGQEPAAPQPPAKPEAPLREEQVKAEKLRAEEMQKRLQEMQSRLLSEKTVHEEQARLAKEYAAQALELQRSLKLSPERQADLARMQFQLQNELSLAGLYKDRLMDFADSEQLERSKQTMMLEARCMELSSLYKESKESDKQLKIEAELGTTIDQLFDLREAQREKDISRLESDLAQMKSKLEERRANKAQIVKRRLDQLLGKKDDLEW